MTPLYIGKIAAAILTVITGCISWLNPDAAMRFTGLKTDGPRGLAEIRAVFGGAFIGLGAAPFVFRHPVAFQVLGCVYLAIAVIRTFSLIVDRSYNGSNLLSLVTEIVLGGVLIL